MNKIIHPLPCLVALLAALCAAPAWANSTLTHVSGQVSLLKLSGQTQAASVGAVAIAGETVSTGPNGYARMKSSDGGWMVLPPNSQIKVEKYFFDERKPTEDSFVFSMLKGAVRTATGYIGKRGNRDAYLAKTSTATIGIRGTQYDMRVCDASNCGKDMQEGTYVSVKDGAIALTSNLGTLEVKAGQVAAATLKAPPVIMPIDPGIGFATPELFITASPFQGTWTGRATSLITTSAAVVEIYVNNGVVTGTSSWNTKTYPPEPFVNAVLQGDTLTYKYKMNHDIGTATLVLRADGGISASFDHGGVVLKADLAKRTDEAKK